MTSLALSNSTLKQFSSFFFPTSYKNSFEKNKAHTWGVPGFYLDNFFFSNFSPCAIEIRKIKKKISLESDWLLISS